MISNQNEYRECHRGRGHKTCSLSAIEVAGSGLQFLFFIQDEKESSAKGMKFLLRYVRISGSKISPQDDMPET